MWSWFQNAMGFVSTSVPSAFFFMYICFTVLILVNIFLAILNATYTQVDRDLTVEHKRLKILESLRPSRKPPARKPSGS